LKVEEKGEEKSEEKSFNTEITEGRTQSSQRRETQEKRERGV